MSLYNMLNGHNSNADKYQKWVDLDLNEWNVGRYRNTCLLLGRENLEYVTPEPTDELCVGIYTRNGGGNRENYQEVLDELKNHPLHVCDYDDDFDNTYATILFRIPEKHLEKARKVYYEMTKGQVEYYKKKAEESKGKKKAWYSIDYDKRLEKEQKLLKGIQKEWNME